MEAVENKKVLFHNVEDGGTFKIGNTDYIKFPDVGGKTPAVARAVLFDSEFGKNNDTRSSCIIKKLQEAYLPEVVAEVGNENVCEFITDLTTLDGLRPYEDMKSRVSLVTLDFYRKHVEIFDKYPVEDWWWLATPDSAMPHGNPWYTLCVSPAGRVGYDCYYCDVGVRPFYILNSSIFGSSEASNG